MIRGFLLLAAVFTGAPGARAAAAQLGEGQSVTCESGGHLARCQAALTWRGARLVRQLSQAPCLQGETWGFERNAIWVDQGCRGLFEVGDPFANIGERVVCASADRGRAECPADTRFSVRLVQRISQASCEEGRSWGTTERAIWVDRGCRGEFEVGGPDRDQVVSPQVRRFSCGAESGRTTCSTGGVATGVSLVEDRSGGRCRQGSTWGSTDSLIWTDRGCRALFEITYHGAKPAGATPVSRRITCGSADARETSCPVGGVVTASRLVADYSAGRCRQPSSWGHTADFLWTARGCQGEFDVSYRPVGRRPVGRPSGATRLITCGTFTGRQATCPAGAPIASLRLRRDLGKGECLSGDTWGHAGTSIWATRGCRGEFEVVFAAGGRRAE
jgi:hypothetical protein